MVKTPSAYMIYIESENRLPGFWFNLANVNTIVNESKQGLLAVTITYTNQDRQILRGKRAKQVIDACIEAQKKIGHALSA
ncbi:hypothetical protein [Spirulina sp. 06S082]|uniref:hypothetical protein n=1 Tax=Spirulina sp. 06S082 TaxID=3110248 RepID=UPI002B1F0F60|nr:hypothetical protein [Spirulina sp. 06S082]MEA5472145.1 hypothetical protein [Spirulina sp. 06S082]